MNGLTWSRGETFTQADCVHELVSARVRACLCVDVRGCLHVEAKQPLLVIPG